MITHLCSFILLLLYRFQQTVFPPKIRHFLPCSRNSGKLFVSHNLSECQNSQVIFQATQRTTRIVMHKPTGTLSWLLKSIIWWWYHYQGKGISFTNKQVHTAQTLLKLQGGVWRSWSFFSAALWYIISAVNPVFFLTLLVFHLQHFSLDEQRRRCYFLSTSSWLGLFGLAVTFTDSPGSCYMSLLEKDNQH